MEKQLNKVRHRDYGRKEIYFEKVEDLARFISLYRDLFYSGAEGSIVERYKNYYWTQYMNTDRFKYKIGFYMNYDTFREMEKDLKLKRRKLLFNKDEKFWRYEKSCRVFIGEPA